MKSLDIGAYLTIEGIFKTIEIAKMWKFLVFQVKKHLKDYLEWEKKVNWIFDCYSYFEQKKVKLVVIGFVDYMIIWQNQIVTSRRRNKEIPIDTWGDIKALMRNSFVSNNYYRELYQKLQGLS